MKCYIAALSKSNIQLQKVSTKIESTAKKNFIGKIEKEFSLA